MDEVSRKHLAALKRLGPEHQEEREPHFRALVNKLVDEMVREITLATQLDDNSNLVEKLLPVQDTIIPDETW
ncbi:MAG: hypothetical protein KAU50_02845 [Candidatus Marinimicrobia bacterium]|nr:hypothetical protein [Candidatus Neomarinimicrobiota bacterium]